MNMTSTISSVPAWLKPPRMATKIPQLHDRIAAAAEAAKKKDPAYGEMISALLRILAVNARLPASPYESGHGGDTLFNHTIGVALKVLTEAKTHSYTGLYSTAGRLVVGLRDSNYKFNPNDPLILIAALAHDIGKIDAFIVKNKKVVGIKRNHDMFSMLMLSRMPEFNRLSFADGRALLGSVGYYHAPQTLPLDSNRRSADDRTIAIMELLRRCDIEVSGGEDISSKVELAEIKTARDKVVSDEDIWGAFTSLVQQPGRVNGTSAGITIGQKWEELVYFNETKTRIEIVKLLGIADPGARGDGTHILTMRLMAILADKELLMNRFDGKEYGPTRALFSVKFYSQGDGRESGSWSACFVITPDDQLPTLSRLKSHLSRAEITRPLMGVHSARNKKQDPLAEVSDDTPKQDPIATPFPVAATPLPFASENDNPFPSLPAKDRVEAPLVSEISAEGVLPEDPFVPDGPNLTPDELAALNADEGSSMYVECDTHAEMAADDAKRKVYAEERKADLRVERESGLPAQQKHALGKIDRVISSGLNAFADTESLASEAVAAVIGQWQADCGFFAGISVAGKDPLNIYIRLDGLKRVMPTHKWDLFVDKNVVNTKKQNESTLVVFRLPE